MNYKLIIRTINLLLLVIGVAMIPALITAEIYKEKYIAEGIGATIGVLLMCNLAILLGVHPTSTSVKPREGFIIAAACWIIAIFVGAMPFLATSYTSSYIDAIFESCASITTTGATVMSLESMPRGLLMWKSILHWLGGMGILVFVLSVLPAMGISGQNLFKAETSSIKLEGRISDSAKIMYTMYFGFTLLEFALLAISKMSVFDAIINTLSSVSTSGLGAHNMGLSYYDSIYIELIIAFFTIAVSLNFSLYHHLLTGNLKEFFGIEIKVFLGIVATAAVLITANLCFTGQYDSIPEDIRYGVSQTISMATTTGYGIADYVNWPSFSKFILFALMFVGGCTSSTSGSIKVYRIIIAFKLVLRNIYQRLHPHAVKAVKIGHNAVSAPAVSQASSYIFVFIATFIVGTLVLSLQGLDIKTTVTSSIAMLSNTGIAFGRVGGSGCFDVFVGPYRLVLCVLMLLGRLELFTLLMLFTPAFWNPAKTKTSV